jgi:hypothetical protein
MNSNYAAIVICEIGLIIFEEFCLNIAYIRIRNFRTHTNKTHIQSIESLMMLIFVDLFQEYIRDFRRFVPIRYSIKKKKKEDDSMRKEKERKIDMK